MALPCQLRSGGPRYFVQRCEDVAAGFRSDLGQPPFDAAFRFSAPDACDASYSVLCECEATAEEVR